MEESWLKLQEQGLEREGIMTTCHNRGLQCGGDEKSCIQGPKMKCTSKKMSSPHFLATPTTFSLIHTLLPTFLPIFSCKRLSLHERKFEMKMSSYLTHLMAKRSANSLLLRALIILFKVICMIAIIR